MVLANKLILGIITTGLGGSLFGGTYYASRETIWDRVWQNALRDSKEGEFDNEWEALKNKLNENSSEKNSNQELKNINDKVGMRTWCNSKYSILQSTIFWNNPSKDLEFVEKFCKLEIFRKLDNKQFKNNTDGQEIRKIKEKAKKISENSDWTGKVNLKDLLDIKGEDDNKKLWDYCNGRFNDGFQGENVKFKTIKEYCTSD